MYNQSGAPTAALLENDAALVDYTLYWVICKNIDEANYLLAIINSGVLYGMVYGIMPKGQFGARHLQKHLWKLPIPEFDPDSGAARSIAEAGPAAAAGAREQLAHLREERGDKLTVTIVRRELRSWLATSPEGRAVEGVVRKLLETPNAIQ